MMQKERFLLIEIGACEYHLRKFEDSGNLDLFNFYYVRLKLLKDELLRLKTGNI